MVKDGENNFMVQRRNGAEVEGGRCVCGGGGRGGAEGVSPCCWLFNIQEIGHVYPRDGSAQTILHAATLREMLQMKLRILPTHNTTPGKPVLALTLQCHCQAPGKVATRIKHSNRGYDSTRERRDRSPCLSLSRRIPDFCVTSCIS